MSIQAVTSTNEGLVTSGTLREALEIRRVKNGRHTVREAVAILVPLCTQVGELHAAGERFFLHPSSLHHGAAGTDVDLGAAASLPTHARDRACVPPECRKGEPGDARASVFSLGAMFYELVTGESVGPGMKRPREVDASLPADLEIVLGKALVADPRHRPQDVAALAQAFHHLAPSGSMPPPPADESHLDHEDGFDVDVSLSMIPPAPAGGPSSARSSGPVSKPGSQPYVASAAHSGPISSPFLVHDAPVSGPNKDDPTYQLAALKARLEADPRPRYVVVKEGMDHGPFNAVELLQQIASHAFIGDHPLRDTDSGVEKPIKEWQEFSLFAHQAGLNREIKQERKALEAVVTAEKNRTTWKALIGVTVLAVIGAAGAGWWLRERSRSKNEQVVREEKASNVDSDAALSAGKKDAKQAGPGGAVGGGGGKFPMVSGGSCEAARAKYVEDYSAQGVPPDLTQGSYAGVLNKGSYMQGCGVPDTMTVSICAAVQNGRAVGVTVVTKPSNPGISGCVKSAVMGLSFPSHPRLDIATTTFAAMK